MRKITLFILALSVAATLRAQTPLTTAVDFTVTTVEGQTFNLFNKLAENKYVCIDFFYYSCVPCQQTAPKVNGAYEYFGCNTSNVYFIGIDYDDNTSTTAAFGSSFGAHYPAASGTDGGANAVISSYSIGAFPTVILIAPNHTILDNDIWPIADASALYTYIQGQGGTPATCPSAGLEENNQETTANMLIVPNPSSGQVKIYFQSNVGSSYVIKIYDLLGQEIFSKDVLSAAAGMIAQDIPSNDFAKGTYIVKIIEGSNTIGLQKLNIIK